MQLNLALLFSYVYTGHRSQKDPVRKLDWKGLLSTRDRSGTGTCYFADPALDRYQTGSRTVSVQFRANVALVSSWAEGNSWISLKVMQAPLKPKLSVLVTSVAIFLFPDFDYPSYFSRLEIVKTRRKANLEYGQIFTKMTFYRLQCTLPA